MGKKSKRARTKSAEEANGVRATAAPAAPLLEAPLPPSAPPARAIGEVDPNSGAIWDGRAWYQNGQTWNGNTWVRSSTPAIGTSQTLMHVTYTRTTTAGVWVLIIGIALIVIGCIFGLVSLAEFGRYADLRREGNPFAGLAADTWIYLGGTGIVSVLGGTGLTIVGARMRTASAERRAGIHGES